MKETIYIRFRNRHYVKQQEKIYLKDIAQIIAPEKYEEALKDLFIHEIRAEDKHLIVIDMMKIIAIIKEMYSEMEVRNVGQSEIIVEIVSVNKNPNLIGVIFVWLILFIGSGLTIMNFHHDVSMQEVHQRIYFLITGTTNKYPLLLQIPYSFGIGLGMILFFNHIFKKKINEEPSPLEVEMFLYQRNLDSYVVLNENEQNNDNKRERTKQ